MGRTFGHMSHKLSFRDDRARGGDRRELRVSAQRLAHEDSCEGVTCPFVLAPHRRAAPARLQLCTTRVVDQDTGMRVRPRHVSQLPLVRTEHWTHSNRLVAVLEPEDAAQVDAGDATATAAAAHAVHGPERQRSVRRGTSRHFQTVHR